MVIYAETGRFYQARQNRLNNWKDKTNWHGDGKTMCNDFGITVKNTGKEVWL